MNSSRIWLARIPKSSQFECHSIDFQLYDVSVECIRYFFINAQQKFANISLGIFKANYLCMNSSSSKNVSICTTGRHNFVCHAFGFALSRAARGNLKFTNDCRRVFWYYVDISPRSESCLHHASRHGVSLGIQASCNLFLSPLPSAFF